MQSSNRGRLIAGTAFLLLALLNAYPLLINRYFPVVDGPAHLYNAHILLDLIMGNNPLFETFFQINPEPVPNWSGHFLLAVFTGIGIPVFIAEKVIMIIISIGIPVVIFQIIKMVKPGQQWVALMTLPFVYTYIFGLGFHNFGLGLFFMFLSLYCVLRLKQNLSYKILAGLFVLLFCTYFSHLFPFLILCLVIGFFFSINLSTSGWKIARKHLRLLFMLLPFLALFLFFFLKREPPLTESYYGLATLWRVFMNLEVLNIFFLPELSRYSLYINVMVLIVSGVAIIMTLKQKAKLSIAARVLLLTSFSLLILYFITPDASSNGSYISPRLLLCFYLFLILTIGCLKIPKPLYIFLFIAIVFIQYERLHHINTEIGIRMKKVQTMEKVAHLIEPGSLVLPIGNQLGKFDNHFSNYLGVEKDILVLKNYEATYGYFPIKWNTEQLPELKVSQKEIGGICNLKPYENEGSDEVLAVNYILLWENYNREDSCLHSEIEFLRTYSKVLFQDTEQKISLLQVEN